ncbi:MAG: hypothetical protein QF704_12250, partial [Anaerolineales bacterium]|nr:hypothetical protein [Anaerolineales bacterium]
SSDSSKVFNGVVNGIVQKQIDSTVQKIQRQNAEVAHQAQLKGEAEDFMQRTGMTQEQFEVMMDKANSKKMTYDDINLIVNRDANNKNVAKNTKQEVLSQMKKAQGTPTSLSGQGSVDTTEVKHDDLVFNQLKSLDLDMDNLFD